MTSFPNLDLHFKSTIFIEKQTTCTAVWLNVACIYRSQMWKSTSKLAAFSLAVCSDHFSGPSLRSDSNAQKIYEREELGCASKFLGASLWCPFTFKWTSDVVFTTIRSQCLLFLAELRRRKTLNSVPMFSSCEQTGSSEITCSIIKLLKLCGSTGVMLLLLHLDGWRRLILP